MKPLLTFHMFIGLTGYMGSGKGAVADYLVKRGLKYISLSDIVRSEAAKRNVSNTRENLQAIGNELREDNGAGVLGMRIREAIKNDPTTKYWVIDSIRNPAEVEELRKLGYFYLLGVTAKKETLIKRLLERKRETETELTEAEVRAKLEKESGKGEPLSGQQISKCLDTCDFFIINEGTFVDLEKKINHFIGLLSGTDRPSFDETFMEIAYTWAKRATCLRRKVGAVIAKDKQQLTAGYNGAPRGMPHCAELGGCLREKLGIPSGQRHELCRGTHAEQNAITQAAKFGINIEGGTLYCNTYPCVICAKMILNAGIKKVVYDSNYDDALSKEMLGSQKTLELIQYEGKKFR